MLRVLLSLIIMFLVFGAGEGSARRVHLSAEQSSHLARIHTILVTSVVLTDRGPVSSHELVSLVTKKFQEVGFSVVSDEKIPHDVEFHVVCEERKRTVGTSRAGGDAELEEMPDRLWRGSACQFRYRLGGADLGWRTEVRALSPEDGRVVGEEGVSFEKSSAFRSLVQEIERFDFPVLVMADWGQSARLADLLLQPETQAERKRLILDKLSGFSTTAILPALLSLIQQDQYPLEAIEALAGAGKEAVPHLVLLFQDRDRNPSIRAAAARGLGRIGGETGNAAAMNPLVEYLSESVAAITSPEDIEFSVLTAVVWAVGQGHSDRVLGLLGLLQSKIWTYHDQSEDMKALRDAASVVSKHLDHVQI